MRHKLGTSSTSLMMINTTITTMIKSNIVINNQPGISIQPLRE
ncbi:hypothetical protein PPBDW_I20789 [Photobacterium kishitanii]|nr:hypothetical protein PPBDW_I20789 [Photobacterium kishitanii]